MLCLILFSFISDARKASPHLRLLRAAQAFFDGLLVFVRKRAHCFAIGFSPYPGLSLLQMVEKEESGDLSDGEGK